MSTETSERKTAELIQFSRNLRREFRHQVDALGGPEEDIAAHLPRRGEGLSIPRDDGDPGSGQLQPVPEATAISGSAIPLTVSKLPM